MGLIKINSITFTNESYYDSLRFIICSFKDNGMNFNLSHFESFKKFIKQVKEKGKVFDRAETKNLEIVVDTEENVDIHVFYTTKDGNAEEWKYLDTCHINNKSLSNKEMYSQKTLFFIDFNRNGETKSKKVDKIKGYYFQLISATCHKKNEWSDDEIAFELKSDANTSRRYPSGNYSFDFELNQKVKFKSPNSIKQFFEKELKLTVWETDGGIFDSDDKLGEVTITGADNTYSSYYDATGDDTDYKIEYKVTPEWYEDYENHTENLQLSENYQNINTDFDTYFNRIQDAKSRMNDLLKTKLHRNSKPIKTRRLSEKKLDLLAKSIHSSINPKNNSHSFHLRKLIEYYQDFFNDSNENMNEYAKQFLLSQYPVMAYPEYPEPVYFYLKEFSEKFILPASAEMPENSMALFVNNAAFVEAFLCGMNTEMGRELLWREYPTDTRGSYFRKFWDSELKEEVINYDIKPIHQWTKQNPNDHNHPLGKNHEKGRDNLLIFAIKGELLKKYPETIIFLSKAKTDGNRILLNPDAEKVLPELSAWISEDTFIVGFPAKLQDLVGNPTTKDPGFFLTFMNKPSETRFGHYTDTDTNKLHAGKVASALIVRPYIFGKHMSQFLAGWK